MWDPIGLKGRFSGDLSEEANLRIADEYDTYLISAASHLRRGEPREQVVSYLVYIESEHMGLGEGPTSLERAEAVVAAIFADQSIWT